MLGLDESDVGCSDEKIDYEPLKQCDDALVLNNTTFTNEEIIQGKIDGLEMLDKYHVYDVEPVQNAEGQPQVDTRWEIRWTGGRLKCRLVGREFKWSVMRDDVFAPASSSMTSRVIDFAAMKDDDSDDELCCFEVDCTCVFYQAPEKEIFYTQPPREWLFARREAGLTTEVTWRIRKQLPGRRAAGARWMETVHSTVDDLGLMRYQPMPWFFRSKEEERRLAVETHGRHPRLWTQERVRSVPRAGG